MLYICKDSLSEILRSLYNNLLLRSKYAPSLDEGTINRKRSYFYIKNVCLQLNDITNNLVYIPGRNFSIIQALTESLMLVNKSNEVKYFSKFNKNVINFSDDGETFYGNYGSRISDKLNYVIEKLKKDKYTRQAVISIYKNEDISKDTKDVPCTLNLVFDIEYNKLNLTVNMRSNDCIWGTPYDIFMFTNLQMVIANTLGLNFGTYTHFVNNMHVYEDMADKIDNNLYVNVKYVNKNNLEEWIKCSEDYVKNESKNNYIYLINKVFELEQLYRENKLRKIDVKNIYNRFDWLINFTKRWEKGSK